MVKPLVLGLIKLYQKTTWFIPGVCRYHPSCSHYMSQAIQRYGVVDGGWIGLKRLLRCTPLHPGGMDPVPDGPKPRHFPPNPAKSSKETLSRV